MKYNTYNVCCVCTGNISRSPLCEAVLKTLVKEEPSLCVDIWSCGTVDLDNAPRDGYMAAWAKSKGYTMGGESHYMNREELLNADCILVFTHKHKEQIKEILDNSHWDRIVLFDFLAFGQQTDVEDPYFQSPAIYERVARHIEDGCMNIVANWKKSIPEGCWP